MTGPSSAGGSGAVTLSLADSIATITLQRPQVGNAIDFSLVEALADAASRCDADPLVRCVVLTGAGPRFCSGGDIALMAQAGDAMPDLLLRLASGFHVALKRLVQLRKPLVVLVNGPAAGAGLSLALVGDVVLSARSARFRAGYGSIGLTPDGGLSWMLPRLVGLRRAQEMILTDRTMDADEAAAAGLVTRSVEDSDLASEGLAAARKLSARAVEAVARARGLLFEGGSSAFFDHLDTEAQTIAAAGARAEATEGIAAFRAKRNPDFPSSSLAREGSLDDR